MHVRADASATMDGVLDDDEDAGCWCRGGLLVTTVDQDGERPGSSATDADGVVLARVRGRGMREAGEGTFIGWNQGQGGEPDPVHRLRAFRSGSA